MNGKCCKMGRTILNPGDVVSLNLEQVELDQGDISQECKLISWKGSEAVATKLEEEGKNISQRKREVGKRKGRMMPVLDEQDAHCTKKSKSDTNESNPVLSDTAPLPPFLQYYRERLASLWIPDIHEVAMEKPLPLTIRVLKPTIGLDKELHNFGFRTVTENDFTLELCNGPGKICDMKLDSLAVEELLMNTWIMEGETQYQNDSIKKQQLGVFLSDARISGELLQQELNSMLPVSILAALLKLSELQPQRNNMRFLDLCAAPGSKTCQLLNTLNNSLLSGVNGESNRDFTVVANELMPQRASRTKSRCYFQSNRSLSHLIVTSGDGRQYANMDSNYFDFVLCDVPCSGDGTIRKSPEKLGKWSPGNAETNKPLQKELLTVGLNLLKPNNVTNADGGLLLYSTCSLNPVENDEVISEVLEEMNKSSLYKFKVVDLGDFSTCLDPAAQESNFLRVLPAASHGGFFVAAIMKSSIEVGNVNISINHNSSLSADRNEMIWAHHEGTGENTICSAVSSLTRQCCTDLAKLLQQSDNVQLIGCGVPALFQLDISTQCVLQEGCCCMEECNLKTTADIIFILLTEAEFSNYSEGDSGKLLIPLAVMAGSTMDGKVNMPCIVKVLATVPNDEPMLLPGKVLNTDESDKVMVEITARPQIMKRLICSIS